MAIYRPDLILTKSDREALILLGQLAIASELRDDGNQVCDAVTLSPSEALKLLELLEKFASSELFAEGAYFVEGMAAGEADSDARLKGIYLSWRSRRGFTNVLSGQRWREFVLRAGFNSSEDAWMWPHELQRSPIRPMKLDHFLAMETKLAATAELHPRVQKLIIAFVHSALPALKALRERKVSVSKGKLRTVVDGFVRDLSDHVHGNEKSPMTRRRVIAMSTILMDTAALFATRDWTAAGVLSQLAAVVPDVVGASPK